MMNGMVRIGVVLALLAVGTVVQVAPVAPDVQAAVYGAAALGALGLGALALRERPARARRGWTALLAGHATWLLGDVVGGYEVDELGVSLGLGLSDLLYLVGYVVLVLGVNAFVRAGGRAHDLTALLDAAILTVGVAIPAITFVLAPLVTDDDAGLLVTVVRGAYPLGDLLVLAMVARFVLTRRLRSLSSVLLVAGLTATLVGDAAWSALLVDEPDGSWPLLNVLWLAGHVLLSVAVLHPSAPDLASAPPSVEVVPAPWRLLLLVLGALMPAGTLAAVGLLGRPIPWLLLALGNALLTVLVLVRLGGLLERVGRQAVQLAALARRDELTGAPNRRTWDHELSRACARARDEGRPLSVAIIDLDRFKAYNDHYGHPGGDRLLRDAVAAWVAELGDAGLLARYGGEEFAVLLPGLEPAEAATVVERLRHVTPHGQTFSAGVAGWVPDTEPVEVVLAADVALYDAKRSGRDRVVVAGADPTDDDVPTALRGVRAEVRTVRDARGDVAAWQVVAGFPHDLDPASVVAAAHREGVGDLLEAAVLRSALALPDRPPGTDLHVRVGTSSLASDRFWDLLPERLDGVVLEVQHRGGSGEAVQRRLGRLRERGARLAVGQVGGSGGEADRLRHVPADVVAIDPHLAVGCADDADAVPVLRALVEMAHRRGATVRADGVTRAEDRAVLVEVGVDLFADDDARTVRRGRRVLR
ncbi:signaling protein [Actinotalea ferrariae CF5-4]|uniref:Signaling protein n=2 Tax=Actinotalea TaxID=458839 RepID=A0A021VSN2_9CELL|nr:signaling protein [Actinotalea ferrariae CF5-4]